MSETRSAKEQLTAHFDKSATVVRAYADEFETTYARPALKTATAFFDEYPISSTFIAIFSALAFFPVITFLTLSLFTALSFAFLALCCAFVATSVVVFFCLSILVLILVAAFFASGFFSVLAISSYITYRFVTLVRSGGRDGVSNWAVEVKGRFITPKRREASDGSAVIVDVKELQDDSFGVDSDVKEEGS
ncbi:hypothetical protein DFH07DRAFT_956021 [Mycena maculata]|uniref:Uncharacterized protein n=1 Tax=Mycena maculata TaxID=230809 RepID=A0AAD7JJE2_9AGAR|nr:hypothetical protein DFH07DRAFT_956021 [Mycena maculata]